MKRIKKGPNYYNVNHFFFPILNIAQARQMTLSDISSIPDVVIKIIYDCYPAWEVR